MRVRTQLSLTSVALVLVPGLLLGGLCTFLMLRQADVSAKVVSEGLRQDAENNLAVGVQRERDFVQNVIFQATADTANLAGSSQAPTALGAVDLTSSSAMRTAIARELDTAAARFRT